MEVLQMFEVFTRFNGKLEYSHVKVFVTQDGILYSGKWSHQTIPPKSLTDIQDIKEISTKNRGPLVKPNWSSIFSSKAMCYVKKPTLLGYADENLDKRMEREIEVCEILRRNPHPNIAIYLGYEASEGRVTGLRFRVYMATLQELVNPEHLAKIAFWKSERPRVIGYMRNGLNAILAAIKHLHSLGMVHNDINPSNIMMDQDRNFILIDFDSCRPIGEDLLLTDTKRTHHWHDPTVGISLEKNDLDAFEDVCIWLSGSSREKFNFA